jgi:uncharacterized membrane protein
MKRVLLTCLGLVIAAMAMSLAVWNKVPDPMPIHWNADGRADGFGSKRLGLLLCPALIVGMPLLLAACFRLDPRRAHITRSAGALGAIVIGLGVFALLVHALTLRAALRGDMRLDYRLLVTLLGGLFVLIGLVLPKLRSNWVAGIRTPWTLSSERVWHLTHRLAGWTFTLAGLTLTLLAWVIDGGIQLFVAIMASLAVAALVPVVYSYVCYSRERGGEGSPQAE